MVIPEMFDALKFNDEIVLPTLDEFHRDFSSLRRAFLAVATLDALAAQIYAQSVENDLDPFELLGWNEKGAPLRSDDIEFRHRIAEDCESFGIIRDVAKANKHAALTRGTPRVRQSEQVRSQSMPYGLGRFGEGRNGGVRQIIVRLNDGETLYLEHIIAEAHDWLMSLVELLNERLAHDRI